MAAQALFTAGQTLTFTPHKGGRTIDAVSFDVSASTTLGDFMQYLNDALAIESNSEPTSDGTVPNDGGTGGQPGVTLAANGQITIVGNAGTVNDINMAVGDLVSSGSVIPLTFTKTQSANGHSTGTDFVVYDSLGQPINVRMTAASKTAHPATPFTGGISSAQDDSRQDVAIATGQLKFDSLGKVSSGGTATFSLERTNTAAVSPMQISMDLSQISGITSDAAGSQLNLSTQDGTTSGTLQSFVIDENGIINGVFDNGIIRTLGQVVLARFANPDGMVEDGNTTYKEGVSSGVPALVSPGTFGVGTIRAGSIELSNTDVGKSLVDLIVSSTNYRGNARVISAVQQLVDELLLLGALEVCLVSRDAEALRSGAQSNARSAPQSLRVAANRASVASQYTRRQSRGPA